MIDWERGTKLKLKSVKEAIKIMSDLFGKAAISDDFISMLESIKDKNVTFKSCSNAYLKDGKQIHYLYFEEDFNLVKQYDKSSPKSYYVLTPEMFTTCDEINENIPCLFGDNLFNI